MAGNGPDAARDIAADHAPAPGSSIAYESPEAVLADDTLSPGQKRRFLEAWREALRVHLAGDEVAAADVRGEAEMVARIDAILNTLARA